MSYWVGREVTQPGQEFQESDAVGGPGSGEADRSLAFQHRGDPVALGGAPHPTVRVDGFCHPEIKSVPSVTLTPELSTDRRVCSSLICETRSLYRPGWPGTQRSAVLGLPESVHHHAGHFSPFLSMFAQREFM